MLPQPSPRQSGSQGLRWISISLCQAGPKCMALFYNCGLACKCEGLPFYQDSITSLRLLLNWLEACNSFSGIFKCFIQRRRLALKRKKCVAGILIWRKSQLHRSHRCDEALKCRSFQLVSWGCGTELLSSGASCSPQGYEAPLTRQIRFCQMFFLLLLRSGQPFKSRSSVWAPGRASAPYQGYYKGLCERDGVIMQHSQHGAANLWLLSQSLPRLPTLSLWLWLPLQLGSSINKSLSDVSTDIWRHRQ